MLRNIVLVMLVLFVLLQLWPRTAANQHKVEPQSAINSVYEVPDSVLTILKTACYDCHSNNTRYPWYSKLQPFSWWLNKHIEEGKKELNFDQFAAYSLKRRKRKLESVMSQIKQDKMPLGSYTIIHRDAKLTTAQKQIIFDWIQRIQKTS